MATIARYMVTVLPMIGITATRIQKDPDTKVLKLVLPTTPTKGQIIAAEKLVFEKFHPL